MHLKYNVNDWYSLSNWSDFPLKLHDIVGSGSPCASQYNIISFDFSLVVVIRGVSRNLIGSRDREKKNK